MLTTNIWLLIILLVSYYIIAGFGFVNIYNCLKHEKLQLSDDVPQILSFLLWPFILIMFAFFRRNP